MFNIQSDVISLLSDLQILNKVDSICFCNLIHKKFLQGLSVCWSVLQGLCFRSPATPTKSLLSSGDAPSSKDLSDPEVLARIGNRAVKTVNKPTSKYFIILRGKLCRQTKTRLESDYFDGQPQKRK